MFVMGYALWVYHWRARAIRKRGTGPYDDRVGPTILCVLLLGTLAKGFPIGTDLGFQSSGHSHQFRFATGMIDLWAILQIKRKIKRI